MVLRYCMFDIQYVCNISYFSHFVTAFYWATLQNKPQVLGDRKLDESSMSMIVRIIVPYIPIFLPILLFCRHTELKLKLRRVLDVGDRSKLELWTNMIDEKLLVRNTANDIKIIGKVIS